MTSKPARAEDLGTEMASLMPRMFVALKAVQARIRRPIGPPEPGPLTFKQMELLMILHHAGGQARVNDLARQLAISGATLSINAKRLIARGYLRKTRDTEDERGVHLALAPKARKVFEAHRRKEVAFFRATFAALPEQKARRVVDSLRFVIGTLLEVAHQ
jgi:DNA-binding MarR family transcriptional regulator